MIRKLSWEIYRSPNERSHNGIMELGAEDFRWRCCSGNNGKIVGASTEGYRRRFDCYRNARLFGAPEALRKANGPVKAQVKV